MMKLKRHRWLRRAAFCQSVFGAVLVAGSGIANAGQEGSVVRLSAPVEVSATHETYGAAMSGAGPVLTLSEVLAQSDHYLNQSVKLTTRVAQVCQKKGCFFLAQEGAHNVRISFEDYSFFVPTNISGRAVTLQGKLVQQRLSSEQAAHFSADTDGNASVEPGLQFEIVASSVQIPIR